MTMFYEEHLTLPEIAKRLGRKYNSVYIHFHRNSGKYLKQINAKK